MTKIWNYSGTYSFSAQKEKICYSEKKFLFPKLWVEGSYNRLHELLLHSKSKYYKKMCKSRCVAFLRVFEFFCQMLWALFFMIWKILFLLFKFKPDIFLLSLSTCFHIPLTFPRLVVSVCVFTKNIISKTNKWKKVIHFE